MNATVEVHQNGRTTTEQVQTGTRLSAVLSTRYGLHQPCGGKGRCRRCTVQAAGALSAPTAAEQQAFTTAQLAAGSRLACQAVVQGDVRVELAQTAPMEEIAVAGAVQMGEGRSLYSRWGVAVDIGTTTVCAQLYGSGTLAGTAVRQNPQAAFGADVISRIEYALQGGGEALAGAIGGAIAALCAELAVGQGITPQEIDALVLSGNTTMLYLLAGRDVRALASAPFRADCLFGVFAGDAGLPVPGVPAGAAAYLPPCIAAFVGADITCALLATGICTREQTALLVDIGTNGELALWHGGQLTCCSTAAGPALEGVGISSGVYGVRGAVNHIWLEDGAVRFSTIGGAAPVGLCGSGVVDAVAALLHLGVIDETGAFQNGADSFDFGGVSFTARDVRMVQLAKGAIRAGIETLLQLAGVEKETVCRLYIAGGFGSRLNLPSAAAIGLLPAELIGCAQAVGNAALAGAAMLLQNGDLSRQAAAIAAQAGVVALDANPTFTEHYMQQMLFEP